MTKRASASLLLALAMAAPLLASCDRAETPPPAKAPAATAPVPTAPVVTAPKALSRGDLAMALERAASDYAAGASADPGIAGRSFVIRLPFGCGGPNPPAGPQGDGKAHWSWSRDRAGINLAVTPADWGRSPLVTDAGAEPTWDGVDGFWIVRPWLTADTCPTVAAPPPSQLDADAPVPQAAPSPMTAGLAVIHSAEGSRLGRRDARGGYSYVIRKSDDKPLETPTQGYRLVLEGRIGAFPDGRPIRCTAESPDRRPVCIAAVQLDVVAFEDATSARLSEWRPG